MEVRPLVPNKNKKRTYFIPFLSQESLYDKLGDQLQLFDSLDPPFTIQQYPKYPLNPLNPSQTTELDSPQSFKIDISKISPNLYGIAEINHFPAPKGGEGKDPEERRKKETSKHCEKNLLKDSETHLLKDGGGNLFKDYDRKGMMWDFKHIKKKYSNIKSLLPKYNNPKKEFSVSGRPLTPAKIFESRHARTASTIRKELNHSKILKPISKTPEMIAERIERTRRARKVFMVKSERREKSRSLYNK